LECLYTDSAAKIVISLATKRFRNSLLRFRNNIFLTRWNAVQILPAKTFLKLERSLLSQVQGSMRCSTYSIQHSNYIQHSVFIFLKMGHFFQTTYEGWNFNSGNYLFTTDTK